MRPVVEEPVAVKMVGLEAVTGFDMTREMLAKSRSAASKVGMANAEFFSSRPSDT
jgi:hypothetical protein